MPSDPGAPFGHSRISSPRSAAQASTPKRKQPSILYIIGRSGYSTTSWERPFSVCRRVSEQVLNFSTARNHDVPGANDPGVGQVSGVGYFGGSVASCVNCLNVIMIFDPISTGLRDTVTRFRDPFPGGPDCGRRPVPAGRGFVLSTTALIAVEDMKEQARRWRPGIQSQITAIVYGSADRRSACLVSNQKRSGVRCQVLRWKCCMAA